MHRNKAEAIRSGAAASWIHSAIAVGERAHEVRARDGRREDHSENRARREAAVVGRDHCDPARGDRQGAGARSDGTESPTARSMFTVSAPLRSKVAS